MSPCRNPGARTAATLFDNEGEGEKSFLRGREREGERERREGKN
jgi:hypothetical protein